MNLSSSLRRSIIIEQPIFINDGIGGRSEQWQEFAKVRAEVAALYERNIGEVFASMQLMNASLYKFRIRYLKGLKNNMRILYDMRYFQIKRIVNQDEQNIVSLIIAQESL